MAITVIDLSDITKGKSYEVDSLTTGNDYIFLVPVDAQITFQGIGSGDADLKTTIGNHGEVSSNGDFTDFATEFNKTTTFIAKTVGEGITAVGLDITSGTWKVRIKIAKNSGLYT